MDENRSGMLTLAIIGIALIVLGVIVIFNAISSGFWLGVVLGFLPAIAGSFLLRRLS